MDELAKDPDLEAPLTCSLGVTAAVVIVEAPLISPGEKLDIPMDSSPPVPINDVIFIAFIDPPIPPKNCDPCAMKPVERIV